MPAYFTDAQRQATIRASELAGVAQVRLLAEPEAAALAYGAAEEVKNEGRADASDEGELVMVFDLGGGTFDVSILEMGGGVTEVLATSGNNRLGGTDFDRRVAEHLSGRALESGRRARAAEVDKNEGGGSVAVKDWYRDGDGEISDIVLRTAEVARKCLSNQKVVEVAVPFTAEGWKRMAKSLVQPGSSATPSTKNSIIGQSAVQEHAMVEGQDYTVVALDRKTFESLCHRELQMLLQPIREAAIMAGALLPGEARPSFVEDAIAMAMEREAQYDGPDFWEFENAEMKDKVALSMKNGKNEGVTPKEGTLDEKALQQIQAMDIKAKKKAQQRGRRKARDISKREKAYRKNRQAASEEADEAALLRQQGLGDRRDGRQRGAAAGAPAPPVPGGARVEEGIHGRPLANIILVGGATRMPVVAKLLEALAGAVPQRTVNPDEAVALGCAVQAGILDGENEGLLGGGQAVLSPMQAALMRALAQQGGMDLAVDGGESAADDAEMEKVMSVDGVSVGGMMLVDGFDDEDDFY